MRELEAGLRDGARQLSLDLSDAQVGRLLDYLALIGKWNKVYNLTAVRDPQEMLTHHLLDSLAAVGPLWRWLAENRRQSQAALLDVGSGGGLPGVVLAICCPELKVDCVDTVAKKAAFIQQAAVTLGLKNLRGLHNRVENLSAGYDVVSSRAFASLADFTAWSGAALSRGGEGADNATDGPGVWLAMKGKHPADEIAALPTSVEVFHVEPLQVPGLDAERCIVWLRPKFT